MKYFICSFFLLLTLNVAAQNTTINFVFTDALGNQDSVTTGVIESGSANFDMLYDSINLKNSAYRENIDIRLSNDFNAFATDPVADYYAAKKNIGGYELPGKLSLEVVSKNWPVQVRWVSTGDVNDSRIQNAIFSESNLAIGSNETMAGLGNQSLNFDSDKPGEGSTTFGRSTFYRATASGDTIYKYEIAFLEDPISVSTQDTEASNDDLIIFPNPSQGQFVQLRGDLVRQSYQAIIYDAVGKAVRTYAYVPERLSVADLAAGWYVLRIVDVKGRYWSKRMLRK